MLGFLEQMDPITLGIVASLVAGCATGIGGIPVFFTRNVPKGLLDSLLGFAAGIMLAATSFSLIVPAIEAAGGGAYGALIAMIGILLGGLFIDRVDRYLPDNNLLQGPSANGNNLRRVWLFVLAITIHNFPEGMAVAMGFASGNVPQGLSLAIAIGLQNMPEGLAVALPLVREGFSVWKAFLIVFATGLVEPIGGAFGIGLLQISEPILPLALAFAAGAMLFVIAHEIIPESQRENSTKIVTHALLFGFVIMMFLDIVLG